MRRYDKVFHKRIGRSATVALLCAGLSTKFASTSSCVFWASKRWCLGSPLFRKETSIPCITKTVLRKLVPSEIKDLLWEPMERATDLSNVRDSVLQFPYSVFGLCASDKSFYHLYQFCGFLLRISVYNSFLSFFFGEYNCLLQQTYLWRAKILGPSSDLVSAPASCIDLICRVSVICRGHIG